MLQRYYIDESNVSKWNKPLLHRNRDSRLFEPPLILCKKGINSNYQCVATFSDKQWLFKDSVTAIKGFEGDENLLKCFLGFLNSKFFTYFSFLTFSSVGIEREQVLKEEFFSLPFIYDDNIVNYVDYILNEYNEDLNSNIKLYEDKIDEFIIDCLSLNNSEKDLISYLFDVTIPMLNKKENDVIWSNISKDYLLDYVNIFLNHFKNYFKEENNEFLCVEIYYSLQFIGVNFKIINSKPKKNVVFNSNNNILNFFGNVCIDESNQKSLYISKDLKGFTEDSFYVIKSNEYKNWHKAVAHRDLLEFMDSLINKGEF